MDAILKSCPGTLGIEDDVAVFGRSEVECAIKAPQISFFGTIYDEKGVYPDQKKFEDIQMIPTPESETELQEFLDIVAYMGSFVLNFSQNSVRERPSSCSPSRQEADSICF